MNTRIDYMYRDASNYKVYNKAVVSGSLSETEIKKIQACLVDCENFIPSQVGLPEKRFDKWDDRDDHCWFELQEICATNEVPTVGLSADTLLSNFLSAKDNWREAERYEELSAMLEHYEPDEEFPISTGDKKASLSDQIQSAASKTALATKSPTPINEPQR